MENKKIHLLSDIDGVAFDWFDGFAKYMVDQGEHYTGALPTRFNMTDVFPLNPAPYKSIADYHASQFYINAPLYPEVKAALETIRDAGIPITFVTSCGDHPEIRRDRGDYFAKHLNGLYDDIIFLPLGDDKDNILKTFKAPNTEYFMIDDQVSVCEVAVKHGITPILKDMDYNKEDNRFMRADNYTQLANHLVSLKNELTLEHDIETIKAALTENAHPPLSRRVS